MQKMHVKKMEGIWRRSIAMRKMPFLVISTIDNLTNLGLFEVMNRGKCVWLGMSYDSFSNQYNWTDGTPMDYLNWYPGKPEASSIYPYGGVLFDFPPYYDGDLKWWNFIPNAELNFICKVKAIK